MQGPTYAGCVHFQAHLAMVCNAPQSKMYAALLLSITALTNDHDLLCIVDELIENHGSKIKGGITSRGCLGNCAESGTTMKLELEKDSGERT